MAFSVIVMWLPEYLGFNVVGLAGTLHNRLAGFKLYSFVSKESFVAHRTSPEFGDRGGEASI
jgi:hypothetical protein